MKYPYIGQYRTTNTETNVLYYKQDCCINMDGKEQKTTDRYNEGTFKNITHEYLQNTYGEVVSPGHAEFIIGLCLENLINFAVNNARRKYFAINGGKLYFFCLEIDASNVGSKKITIPLPPKESIKNAGDNLILGCEDSKCDEWIPQVGDKVLIDVSGYDVIYGKNIDGLTAVVRSIFKDGEATVYAVSRGGACYCFTGGILKKPKTPEEELRDEIADIIDNASCSEQAAEYIVKEYLAAISKKPQ